MINESVSSTSVTLSNSRRQQHIVVLGKTGSGKSFLIRHLVKQDIRAGRGALIVDFHGDMLGFVLGLVTAEERRHQNEDLSSRLIAIEPGDPSHSAGLNFLEIDASEQPHVRIAEFAHVLRRRWQLDSLGARTEELLRNSLFVLAASRLTLTELATLLTNDHFRAACLRDVRNPEVLSYFRARYETVSESMQAAMREPILNKASTFTDNPQFRHIVGQRRSTFSLTEGHR